MGLKHEKYVYVRRDDGKFVKVRSLKSRAENEPSRYIVVGRATRRPPLSAKILSEKDLPEQLREELRKA